MALKNWLVSFANTIVLDGAGAAEDELKREGGDREMEKVGNGGACFQMPLHYPRYVRSDYEKMEEWRLELLLREYGLSFSGDLEEKRKFAIGAFLWPDQF